VSATVLVTGATSGIGRAAAVALAERGWWVAASGRDAGRGAEIAAELGDRGAFIAADLTADGAPDRLVAAVVERRGRLDAVVSNAAVYDRATVAELPVEQLDAILAADLRAPILLARAAVREMAARGGGVIVNVSSEAGIAAVPGQVAYNVAKAGLNMLTRSIAVDHAEQGVRAVSVCPGTTRTPLVEAAIAAAPDPEAHERSLADNRPAKRLGRVEEIAAAICFAASPEAGFMTGSELVIDGGYTAA
jgi:NAD(P)-dependent dehydrogenase (short-subunit alcohol dehydrogenase family)